MLDLLNDVDVPSLGEVEIPTEELYTDICHLTTQIGFMHSSNKELSEPALEGIANLTKRLIAGVINYLNRIMKNVSSSLKGVVLAKRSVLKETTDKARIHNSHVGDVAYTAIHKTAIPFFMFKQDPVMVANFFNDTLKQLGMESRLKRMGTLYGYISAYIKLGDNTKMSDTIDQLNDLNISPTTSSVISELKTMVITRPPRNRMIVGDVFNSSTEIARVRDLVLMSQGEISTYLNASKLTKKIEKNWESIIKSLGKVSPDLKADLVKRLADTIDDTAKLLNMYATTALEYHHLEIWVSNVLKPVFGVISKEM